MKRRTFSSYLIALGTFLAGGPLFADKIAEGRCGAKCSQCEKYAGKECSGCGINEKANCMVFRCNSRRGMTSCSQCKVFPCSKQSRISPPASALQ